MIETDVLTLQEKREIVNRVANSNIFRRAPKLREFFSYVADCTLKDHLEDARAQTIAEKVFHRTPERYEGGDTIVRAEARNLRKRLDTYFQTEGLHEQFLVVMPKGSYSLAFKAREDSPPSAAYSEPARSLPSSRVLLTLCICSGLLAAVSTILAVHWYPRRAKLLDVSSASSKLLPFSALFTSKRDTLIVTSDTAFLKISELEGRRLTLNEYLIRAYAPVPRLYPPDLIQNLNWSEFTDAAETKIAGLIMRKNANDLQRASLRSGRQVQLSDFKTQNAILLGSKVSNPWAELYTRQLNFQFDLDKKQGVILVNRSPAPGELPVYPTKQDDELNPKYAQIAFLPNASLSGGNVLLVAGTTAEATAAAGEFLLDDSRVSRALEKIGVNPRGAPRYWEVLLRATTFVGGATHAEVIGYRVRPYESP